VFVVLKHETRWKAGDESNPDWVVKAYNMVKHGFNATTMFTSYEQAARDGSTAIVLEIPRTNEVAQRFGQETDLTGILCREIARMTLDLDEVDCLTACSGSADARSHAGQKDIQGSED
jgi:hypothetical protein